MLPCGDWKGFAPEGTESRRFGVLPPNRPTLRDTVEIGDPRADPLLGLPGLVEKVADVGVLKPPGDWLE